LHAIVEKETSLALYYWECKCEIKKYGMILRYVHPSNHEDCEKCGAKAKDAPLSPAGYAQAFYSILYDLDMDIEYPSDKRVKRKPLLIDINNCYKALTFRGFFIAERK
jgi:hypothetical protein